MTDRRSFKQASQEVPQDIPQNMPHSMPQNLLALILSQRFDLAGARSLEVQFYHMETRVIQFAQDGKRDGIETFYLDLSCTPAGLTGKGGDEYICHKFSVQKNKEAALEIPALKGWTYIFRKTANNRDEKGQVLGIDHTRFEKLLDAEGKVLPPGTAYFIYNAFIDFHSFCDSFARPTSGGGKGIQDLNSVGQNIIHQAAFSEPSVDLGSHVATGSTFKNGEVILTFKGLGWVSERPCAIIAFDSGESSFAMIMSPLPGQEAKTIGASHYKGDIFIDLETRWVKRAEMTELVVSETSLPGMKDKIGGIVERQLKIESVTESSFPS